MTESADKTHRRYTIAEYLALEEAAVEKHEFHDGEILAMSGNSFEHSQIAANLLRSLGNRLLGTPCQPLDSNMRVRVTARNRFVYPDVSVVCGEPQFDPSLSRPVTLTNPRVIFEILSESTQSYDRGDKFDAYRTIPSLEEYVLVAQDNAYAQTFHRQSDGSWRLDPYEGIDAVVKLRSLSIELPLTEVFHGVKLPPPTTPKI